MRLREWIATFRSLHEKARRGLLTDAETTTYREAREELLAMLLAAQRLTLRPGETVREAPRAVRALPLEIHSTADTVTLDISTGGFAALLSRPFRVGEQIEFSLWLSSGPCRVGLALRACSIKEVPSASRSGSRTSPRRTRNGWSSKCWTPPWNNWSNTAARRRGRHERG